MMKSFSLSWTLLQSNFSRPKKPYKLNLYITDKCNCRCKTCNIWQKPAANELSVAELTTFFQKNNYFSWIDITGGEIFLRNDLDEILEMIVRECPNLYLLHFPTNGMLTDKIDQTVKHIKRIFKGRLVVSISIDGDEPLHDSLRGVNGCWQKAVETYQRISAINTKNTYIGYTLSNHNCDQLQTTYRALKHKIPDLAFDALHINVAQYSDLYYANKSDDLISNQKPIIETLTYVLSKRHPTLSPFYMLETQYLKLLKHYLQKGFYPHKRCESLNSTITVSPTGDVYPCLYYDHKLGSLRAVDFQLDKILNGPESQKLKKDILKYCPHCWTACEAYPTLLSNLFSRCG